MATARRGTGRDKHEDKNVQVCKSATGKRKTEKEGERGGGHCKDVEHFAKVFTWLVGNFLLCCFIGIYV